MSYALLLSLCFLFMDDIALCLGIKSLLHISPYPDIVNLLTIYPMCTNFLNEVLWYVITRPVVFVIIAYSELCTWSIFNANTRGWEINLPPHLTLSDSCIQDIELGVKYLLHHGIRLLDTYVYTESENFLKLQLKWGIYLTKKIWIARSVLSSKVEIIQENPWHEIF